VNNYLLKAASILLKLANKSLNLAEGNLLLSNAVGSTIEYYQDKALDDEELKRKLDDGLLFVLFDFEEFIKEDTRYPSVSLKVPGRITFAQQPVSIEESGKDDTDDKRVSTTLGRYIKRNYFRELDPSSKPLLTDEFVDDFVKRVTTAILEGLDVLGKDVEEGGGESIIEKYRESKAKSCMNDESCIHMTLLSSNSNKVSLVTKEDNARALLWIDDEGDKILDRVYPAGGKYVLPLRRWAEKKGYILRENPDQLVTTSQTVELSDGKEHKVTLKAKDIENFPYLDTFRFGKFIGDDLVLSNDVSFGDLLFDNEKGKFHKFKYCDKCGGKLNEKGECPSCVDDDTCKNCGVSFDDDSNFCEECASRTYE